MSTSVIAVKASYNTLVTFKNVEVWFPGDNDPHLKFVRAHIMQSENGNVRVKPHFRRGDVVGKDDEGGNIFVTKNFYVDPMLKGTKMVADRVDVVIKTDNAREGRQTIILDIIQEKIGASGLVAELRLKVGSTKEGIAIPGVSGRFIRFEPVEPRV